MLSDKKQKVAEALAVGGKSHEQICKENGISRTTLYTWRVGDPEFAALIEELQSTAKKLLRQDFASASRLAFETLTALLSSKNAKIRAEAAKAILDRGGLAVETVNRIELAEKPTLAQPLRAEEIKLQLERIKNEKKLLKSANE